MSWPLRIEYEGAWYHALNRGRGGRVISPDNLQTPERSEVPEYTRRRFKDPAAIIEAAAAASGLTRAELTARGRPARGKRLVARQLAMRLCRDETGLTLREISEWFGEIHYASVSQNIRRAERDLKTDRTVRRLNNDILLRLDS